MKVADIVPLDPGHSIEFGTATWDANARSVRNRYDNEDGTFSPHGSSELPIPDLVHIIVESARRDIIDSDHVERMIGALVASVARRSVVTNIS